MTNDERVNASFRISIGRWVIEPHAETGKIWISDEGGEGGEFSIAPLEAAIGKFYAEHF